MADAKPPVPDELPLDGQPLLPLQDNPSPLPQGVPPGFWSGETLLHVHTQITKLIEPFYEKQIDCNCYTLRMGHQYFVTSTAGDTDSPTIQDSVDGKDFNIPAGQFAFLISKEEVFIPPFAMAFISMRTPFKFEGLINVSGFNVDPGYKGKLVFAVYNASPSTVQIRGGEPLFKIWFASLDQQSGRKRVYTAPGNYAIDKKHLKGMNRELLSLQQLNEKIRTSEEELKNRIMAVESKVEAKLAEQKPTVDNLYTIWRTVTVGVVAAALFTIFSLFMTFTVPIVLSAGRWIGNKVTSGESTPASPPAAPKAAAKQAPVPQPKEAPKQ